MTLPRATMFIWRVNVLLIVLIAVAALTGGCDLITNPTSTPAIFDGSRPIQDRIASGEKIYTATIKELTVLRNAKVIDDATQLEIKAIRQ